MSDELIERVQLLEDRVAKLEGKRTAAQETGFKLCYVKYGIAYFTTLPLSEQWGDDWNDAPYEHNAGEPYYWDERRKQPKYEITTIRYDGMSTPEDLAYGNSVYSVEDINSGRVAWLTAQNGDRVSIFAGASVEEFKQKVRAAGGIVYKVDED